MKRILGGLLSIGMLGTFIVGCGGGGGPGGDLSRRLIKQESFKTSQKDLEHISGECSAAVESLSFDSGESSHLSNPGIKSLRAAFSGTVYATTQVNVESNVNVNLGQASPQPSDSSLSHDSADDLEVVFTSTTFVIKVGSQVVLEGAWREVSENRIEIAIEGLKVLLQIQFEADDTLNLQLPTEVPPDQSCSPTSVEGEDASSTSPSPN